MPKISLVIRCYNEEAHIGRLLSGITQQSVDSIEIILVDSGSTDATLSIASHYPAKILNIKREEFSFGRSLNMGCEAATGEYLVFASAHVYPLYRDWLQRMVEPFENDRIACVYGKQRGNDATKFSEHQVFAKWFPETSDLVQDHPFCNNANAAVRRSVWETLRYDEMITGLEDLDWARKVISAGSRIAYVADAEVIHVHEESALQVLNRYRREAIAMKSIFPNEKFSFFNFLYMFLSNSLTDSRLGIERGVFWSNFRSILSFRLMQFWGTYRGYAQRGETSKALRSKFYYPNEAPGSKAQLTEVESERAMIDYSAHEENKER